MIINSLLSCCSEKKAEKKSLRTWICSLGVLTYDFTAFTTLVPAFFITSAYSGLSGPN